MPSRRRGQTPGQSGAGVGASLFQSKAICLSEVCPRLCDCLMERRLSKSPRMKLTILAALLLSFTAHAQTVAPAAKPAAPAVKLPPQAPDVAAPKLGPDGKENPGFVAAHE